MFNEDQTLVLVFNGEIFNYRDLRRGLLSRGHRFCSESDGEVLLHLYEEEGTALCRLLEGMFAFAIWDRPRQQLFAARDPFGEKPFYYYQSSDSRSLAFASSVAALVKSGLAPFALNADSLAGYIVFGASLGNETLAEGVRTIPAGCHLTFTPNDGRLMIEPYQRIQSLADQALTSTEPGPTPLLWGDVLDAVRKRMIADVPVGVFLSGGLDSSAIAAALKELYPDRIKSFTVGYEAKNSAFDETTPARQAATLLGTEHYEEVVTARDFANSLDSIIAATDLPSHDGVNTFFASRLAARHVKVVLNGIGADELFGGYSTFRYEHLTTTPAFRMGRPFARMTLPLFRQAILTAEERGRTVWPYLFLEQSPPDLAQTLFRWYQVRRLTPPEGVSRLLAGDLGRTEPLLSSEWGQRRDRLIALFGLPDRLVRSMPVLEVAGYLSPVLLRDSDAMSMYHSLELRIPFLDTAFVRLALQYSLDQLMTLRSGKQPMRRAIAGHVPNSVMGRRKQGFGIPIGAWLDYPSVREAVLDEFASLPQRARGLLDEQGLKELAHRFYHDNSPPNRHYRLVARTWMMYCLLRWIRRMGCHQ